MPEVHRVSTSEAEPTGSHRSGASTHPPRDTWVFAALLLLLAWLPIPLGSNRPWSWAIMQAGVFALLAVWLTSAGARGFLPPQTAREAGLPLLLLGAWLAFTLFQLVPLPPWLHGLLSPKSYELYQKVGPDGGTWGPLSVTPSETWSEALKRLAYIGIYALTLVLVRTRTRLVVAASTLVIVGVGEALFGVYAEISQFQFVPTELRDGHWHVVAGTFVNRNHFAALLEVSIAVGLGLFLAAWRPGTTRGGGRAKLRAALRFLLSWRPLLVAALAILVTALLLSKSRGGILAVAVGFSVVATLGALLRARATPEFRLMGVIAGLAIATGVIAGWGGLGERFAKIPAEGQERLTQWRLTLGQVRDFPLFGSGAGSYGFTFPAYKSGELRPLYYDHAHNDPLELLAEQGLVGAALLGGALLVALYRMLRAYGTRRDPVMRGMLFGALAGTTAMLLHGLVDFPFQIPADAAYFFVLLGLGSVACVMNRHRHHPMPGTTRSSDTATPTPTGPGPG